ncbi:MAG: hypothetical protein IJJ26_03135 [Victivallales bacterium]|nr:hypothetical protein [Victivallales bacterium]
MSNPLDNAIAVLRTHQDAEHGPLGAVSPLPKVLVTFSYLLLAVSFRMHDVLGTALFAALPYVFGAICRISPWFLLKRASLALPFVLCAGLANCWFDRVPVAVLPHLAIPGGVLVLLGLVCKTLGTVSAVTLLAATTSITQISAALTSLHVPCPIVVQLQLLFRYLLLTFEEMRTIVTAYHLRAASSRGIPLRHWGTIVTRAFLRAGNRGNAIYFAMQCRLFDARRPLPKPARPSWQESLATVLAILALVGLRYFLP